MAVATGTIPAALVRSRTDRRRAIVDRLFRGLCLVAAVVCVIPLFLIVAYVVVNGIQAINLDLLTKPPRALGVGGGAAAAILGTIQLVGLASLIAIPAGILAAVYVNEFSHRRSATAIRFAADVLVGIPSILMGIFVFTFLVLPFKQYNAFAGAVALALLMVPVIMRTTEEMLRLVPGDLREASFALGVPTWRTVMSVVIRTGLPGILTGVMLAVARAAGETAPLLFTILTVTSANPNVFSGANTSLPSQIFSNASQPYTGAQDRGWGAALTLIAICFILMIVARFVTARFTRYSR